MLFQIVDDILDVTGSREELGKQEGADERLGKRTYVTEFGLEGPGGWPPNATTGRATRSPRPLPRAPRSSNG